ncbi:MAG: STAS domain-containing protein [Candidatus Binatia bacterium]
MLRITADDHARILTFRLEGRLEGPWVRELERCWRSLLDTAQRPTISVDLTDVTHIDAAGKAQLADMHEHGAHFIADDCMTKAVVEEIVGASDDSEQAIDLNPTNRTKGS